jgi:CRP-like cAMP-binding protein
MLTIKSAFKKLIKLLTRISGPIPLPIGFPDELWELMEEYMPVADELLVMQGELVKYAYYIIRGYIYVYFFDEDGNKNVKRFYKEDRIVAFGNFLHRTRSPFYIVAGRDTLLSRISREQMDKIYTRWSQIESFAKDVVMDYDLWKDGLRSKFLRMEVKERVNAFYKYYPCLLPASSVRLDELVAIYLDVSMRTLSRYRGE